MGVNVLHPQGALDILYLYLINIGSLNHSGKVRAGFPHFLLFLYVSENNSMQMAFWRAKKLSVWYMNAYVYYIVRGEHKMDFVEPDSA